MLLSDVLLSRPFNFVFHLASAATQSYHVSEIHFQVEDFGLFFTL